jgi:hypothetical protein
MSEPMTPTPPAEPQTHEEAWQFHNGYLAGAAAYAAAVGHSTLRQNNLWLSDICDEQGGRTIKMFKKVAAMTCTVPNRRNFDDELCCLLNKYSKEKGSNTPDFILVEYLNNCLESWRIAIKAREEWYTDYEREKMAPLVIEVEKKSRQIIERLKQLAELCERLTPKEIEAIGERLKPDLDALEEIERVYPWTIK